jgi:enoyl-CoA hydratase/carnithine racemase
MPTYLVEEVALTGKRYTGTECAEHHLIVAAYPNEELMDRVMAFAKGLNKYRGVVGEMKRVLHANIIKLMEKDDLEYIKQGNIAV